MNIFFSYDSFLILVLLFNTSILRVLKKKRFFFQRHLAFTIRAPEVLPLQKFLKHAKNDKYAKIFGGLGVGEKKILFWKMNKGNKTTGMLLTLFLILDPFSSILLKKVTSCQKFLRKSLLNPSVKILLKDLVRIFSETCAMRLVASAKCKKWDIKSKNWSIKLL